jgi:hypothetical protein
MARLISLAASFDLSAFAVRVASLLLVAQMRAPADFK